jgi:hypothetical protein
VQAQYKTLSHTEIMICCAAKSIVTTGALRQGGEQKQWLWMFARNLNSCPNCDMISRMWNLPAAAEEGRLENEQPRAQDDLEQEDIAQQVLGDIWNYRHNIRLGTDARYAARFSDPGEDPLEIDSVARELTELDATLRAASILAVDHGNKYILAEALKDAALRASIAAYRDEIAKSQAGLTGELEDSESPQEPRSTSKAQTPSRDLEPRWSCRTSPAILPLKI